MIHGKYSISKFIVNDKFYGNEFMVGEGHYVIESQFMIDPK